MTERADVKRADAFWQVLILFLVFMMMVGIYTLLAATLLRLRESRVEAAKAPPPGAVQFVQPADGSVLLGGQPLAVRAVLRRPDLLQAELQVDGLPVAGGVNPDPQAVPWMAEFVWREPAEGGHELTVVVRDAGAGDVEVSASAWVTVVPSGTLLFASNRDGPYAIYAMRTDGRDARRLTTGPGDARQPAGGAADGVLTFVAGAGAGQAVIEQLAGKGGGIHKVVPGRDPAWSPSGTRLAYAASVEGISQVWVWEAGEARQITVEAVYAGQPTWSPAADGRLAYVAERDNNLDLWIVDAPGGEPRRVTHDPATDWAPAWSPDGKWLAFVSDRGGSHQIYLVRADGASDVRRLTDFSRGAESPAWSPDGYWLAFVAYTGEAAGINGREIYLMRAGGDDAVRLTHNVHDDTEPIWAESP